ncbi:MAG TPA: hypothetical protein VKT18_04395, partial [Acidimicrobiales bacterium]|nr:hypothetical protein [Acidimicrobiales bacterium]
LGPHADARVARAARAYRAVVPATRAPLALQFLDEDDAARGLLAAGMTMSCGVWNLATSDWLGAHAIARLVGGRVVRVPLRMLLLGSEIAFRAGALPFGADRTCFLAGPLALDPSLAEAAIGWKATRSSADVLAPYGSQRYMRHVR